MFYKYLFEIIVIGICIQDKLLLVDTHMIPTIRDSDHHQPNNKQTSLRSKHGTDHHNRRVQRDQIKKRSDQPPYQTVQAAYTNNDEYRLHYEKSDPKDNSEYVMKYIQTATVPLNKNGNRNKSRIHVSPDHDKSQLFLVKKNTIGDELNAINLEEQNKKQKRNLRRRNHNKGGGKAQQQRLINDNNKGKLCVKCPPERTVVAQKYLDGAVIELPNLSTCRNQQISKSLYELETLFGVSMNYVLPEGDHQFLARIFNKKSSQYEQNCVIKYKVIVRQCARYYPKDRHLRITCDLGNVWGSACHFTCKNNAVPSHNEPIECSDDTQWVGEEPECIEDVFSSESDNSISKRASFKTKTAARGPITEVMKLKNIETELSNKISTTYCDFPLPPEHGKFSCEIKNDEIETTENGLSIAAGSVCRIECDPNYEIPTTLYRHSIHFCTNGSWNSTITNVCRYI